MVVQNQSQIGEGSANPTDPQHTPTFITPSPQPQKTQKPRKPRKDTQVPQPSDPMEIVCDENEIASLKRRVKKLEKKDRSRTHKLKRLYKVGLTTRVESSSDEEILVEDASKQGRINAIDADEEITLVSAAGDKVSTDSAATTVNAATTTTSTTVDDITLAQVLEEMKSTKPKHKRVVKQELGKGESTRTISSQLSSQQSQDKGKGIWIEPVKKKDQISFDEETALKLEAEFDEEERLAREKAKKEQEEANIALIETWDDI
ncbi:hypothetical protein Tco_0449785 [Tanacetum coccineum]